jgi:ABC-type branched-subunit amino acid transport system ATPase component
MTRTPQDTVRLAAADVTVRFGGLLALRGVSISVSAGTIVGLVGPNGAGKSTLFSVLSGLRRPDAGTVTMEGRDVTAASPQARAHRGLARTFQHPELFQGLTVREHLVLAHRIRHSPRRILTDLVAFGGFRPPPKAETEAVDGLIEALQLGDVAQRPATGLPLGQARLVEIGRALAREPSVLLLDEASSGLDPGETDDLAAVLLRISHERGISLLVVEHDIEFVLGLSSRVVVLDFGTRIADGTPAEIRADPAVQAAYLGADPALAGGHVSVPGGAADLDDEETG